MDFRFKVSIIVIVSTHISLCMGEIKQHDKNQQKTLSSSPIKKPLKKSACLTDVFNRCENCTWNASYL